MIDTTMIPEPVNGPYGQLLGDTDDPGEVTGAVGQTSFEQPRTGGMGEAPIGQRLFSRVPGPIKLALAGARAKYPAVRVADLMLATVPPIRYLSIKVGPTGACLDMLCLGACLEPGCTYKHPLAARLTFDPTWAAAAATKLKAWYIASTASQG
jgi:hypothetical protein